MYNLVNVLTIFYINFAINFMNKTEFSLKTLNSSGFPSNSWTVVCISGSFIKTKLKVWDLIGYDFAALNVSSYAAGNFTII